MAQDIAALRQKIAHFPQLQLLEDDSLPRLRLETEHAELEVYLHGAHISHYCQRGSRPLLFMSAEAQFEEEMPIRGGVPVIFPWFGPRREGRSHDPHGFARNLQWELTEVVPGEETQITFELKNSARTQLEWAAHFRVRYYIYCGSQLTLSLEIENLDEVAFTFEAALHTYFSVSDIRQVSVQGLEETTYIDSLSGERREQKGVVRFESETDRIYLNVPEILTIEDPGFERSIVIDSNALSAIVWNPWIEKAARMKDFGDDEWPAMLCVESGAVRDNEVTLFPGETTLLSVTYSENCRPTAG